MRVKSNGKKPLLMIAALALVVALSIGLTSAFLTSTRGLTNTFTPGEVSCEVKETVQNKVKSDIVVENTGTIPAYIRVAVVANTVDAEGNITGSANVSGSLGGEGWVQGADGYYYYTKIVEPERDTSNLVKAPIPLSNIQVTVLAQAIQAYGVSGETPAVKEAWGSSVNSVAADGSLVIIPATAGN